jgi:hypothetical protein
MLNDHQTSAASPGGLYQNRPGASPPDCAPGSIPDASSKMLVSICETQNRRARGQRGLPAGHLWHRGERSAILRAQRAGSQNRCPESRGLCLGGAARARPSFRTVVLPGLPNPRHNLRAACSGSVRFPLSFQMRANLSEAPASKSARCGPSAAAGDRMDHCPIGRVFQIQAAHKDFGAHMTKECQ